MLEIIIYSAVVAGAVHMGQTSVKSFITEIKKVHHDEDMML